MEGATPARLYATAVGALLVAGGIAGFFYTSSFGSPGPAEEMFGVFAVNGWHNVLHVATGAIGLLVAGYAARVYALWLGCAYLAIALWGFAVGGGDSILGLLPVNTADNLLHLALGALGVAATLATPARGRGTTGPAMGAPGDMRT